jgi:hypothetical protein
MKACRHRNTESRNVGGRLEEAIGRNKIDWGRITVGTGALMKECGLVKSHCAVARQCSKQEREVIFRLMAGCHSGRGMDWVRLVLLGWGGA